MVREFLVFSSIPMSFSFTAPPGTPKDVVVEDASFIWPSRGAVSFDELWADEVPIVHGEVRLGLKLKGTWV